MNRWIQSLVLIAVALVIGVLVGRQSTSTSSGSEAGSSGEREVLYYKAPMDPNFRSDQPGKSPMGMDLVPVYADEADGGGEGVVSISATVINNLGVRTATVEQGTLARPIATVGYVGYNEDTLHKISPRVDGWIEKLAIKAMGDPVSKGQVLFELYSPTLVNAQEEFLAALQSRNTALHNASRGRLLALGFTPGQIARLERERRVAQRIDAIAPSDGVITHLGVREGQYITAATDIMAIGALDEVWVHAEVFERQAGWVAEGQDAVVTTDAHPGRQWSGTVDYVYPELDPKTRTLSVRIRLANPEQQLLPNMFAHARILVPSTDSTLYIPRQALIPNSDVNRVVVVVGDGQYRSQPVEIGIESGEFIEIRQGLSAGERIVTSGQFLIDSESNIDSALSRMASSHDADSMKDAMASSRVQTAATVFAIDKDNRVLTLEHAPIPEWSWPTMTMDFVVEEAISLDGLSEGQSIHVGLEKGSEGDVEVISIMDDATAEHDHSMPETDMSGGDHSNHDMGTGANGENDSNEDPHAGHDMGNQP